MDIGLRTSVPVILFIYLSLTFGNENAYRSFGPCKRKRKLI